MLRSKFLVAASAVLLSALLAGYSAPKITQASAAPQQSAGQMEQSQSERREEQAKVFTRYAVYGLHYDKKTGQLTYEGKRVRYFEDLYPIVWGSPGDGMAGVDFFDEAGVIDLHATRDLSKKRKNDDGSYDTSGILTGVVPYSKAEFDARDLEALRDPKTESIAGEPMSTAELRKQYAPYAAYGLTYDAKKDRLYYKGQQVRRFVDIFSTNGEAPESGKFKGSVSNRWNDGGVVDVRAVRDYTKRDAQGYGRLTGLKVATQAEFDAATKQAGQNEPQLRVYDYDIVCTEVG